MPEGNESKREPSAAAPFSVEMATALGLLLAALVAKFDLSRLIVAWIFG